MVSKDQQDVNDLHVYSLLRASEAGCPENVSSCTPQQTAQANESKDTPGWVEVDIQVGHGTAYNPEIGVWLKK